ncbi:CHAT domain-containing protein [Candidatus Eisenbacteria bacterium]|uniref:CHAT domain-containing protein n=1 Tax=Eiseniibacteriota bacterium TaxID=2212470 RepID=A0ABV6YKE1_UNCEI
MVTGHRSLNQAESTVQDSLRQTLSRHESQLAALQEASQASSNERTAEDLETTRTRLSAAEAAWSTFHEEIARKYPVSEGQAFPLERVQETLTDQTALIGWLHVEINPKEVSSWGYVIRNEDPVEWVRLDNQSGRTEMSADIEKAREVHDALTIASAWPCRPASVARITGEIRKLWRRWMAPLTQHLVGVEHLVVIPSGPMLGIPIEALVDSDSVHLGDHFTVSYTPSATIHTWLWEQSAQRRAPMVRSALLVGDPPFTDDHLVAMEREAEDQSFVEGVLFASAEPPLQTTVVRSALFGNQEALASLPRLPRTRDEVERVASAIPAATTLLGPEASEQRLFDLAESGALRGFDIIHLATHALVDDALPERSALVLSRVGLPDPHEAIVAGARVHDGLLTAKEIVREWDLDADLVTLSGCQTGLGRKAAGEGHIGLAHAFLQAGARSILVSLWKAEEEATSLLMTRFYENLTGAYRDERDGRRGESMPKAAALREAKRWLRTYIDDEGHQPFQHPSYWSGFVLIGEP